MMTKRYQVVLGCYFWLGAKLPVPSNQKLCTRLCQV